MQPPGLAVPLPHGLGAPARYERSVPGMRSSPSQCLAGGIALSGLVALVSLGVAPAALGQQAAPSFALPETVVTATRLRPERRDLAGAITVIDEEEIRRKGYRTVEEALSSVPGLQVVRSGAAGKLTSIFIRGAESDHVMVLLDGVPIRDPSSPNFDFGKEALTNIARIEVYRGAASTAYGSNSIGGVINLVPKVGGDDPFSGRVRAYGGTQASHGQELSVNGSTDRVDYGVSVTAFATNGQNVRSTQAGNTVGEADSFENQTGSGKLVVHASEDTRLSLTALQRRSINDIDDFAAENLARQNDDRLRVVALGGAQDWLDGRATTELRLSATDSRRMDNLPGTGSPYFLGRGRIATLTQAYQAKPEDGLANLGAVIGLEQQQDEFEQRNLLTQERKTRSGFAELSFDPIEPVTLSGAVRRALLSDREGANTWRVGALWRLPEPGWSVYGSVATGFQAPSLPDLYGQFGTPTLESERSKTYELGVKAEGLLPLGADGPSLDFDIAVFDMTIDNLIEFRNSRTQNSGRLDNQGIELAFGTQVTEDWRLSGQYAYLASHNDLTSRDAARRPRHRGGLDVVYSGLADVELGAGIRHVGNMADGNVVVPSYTLVDASVRWRPVERWTLFATGTNLADRDFETIPGFAGEGRVLFAGVEWEF